MRRTSLAAVAVTHLAIAHAPPAAAVEEMVVTSPRIAKQAELTPVAVSAVTQDEIQLGRQQIGIDEALNRVPGVFFQNRYNLNQDLRISIRGFGARAQFGINGIRIAVDDIPLTTPDGTSQVDDLDISSMGRIEVIRGPSAALFGTASGGAINIYSEAAPDRPFVEARATLGEYSQEQVALKSAGKSGKVDYLASVRYQQIDGFRDHAEARTTTFNSRVRYEFDPTMTLTAVVGGVDKPEARDPGALTPSEVAAGPRSRPRQLNVDCNVREIVEQYRGGLVLDKSFEGGHEVRLRGYALSRDFDANLPCPFVDQTAFERLYFGGGAQYGWSGELFGLYNQFIAGFELTSQEDDRVRFDTDGSGNRGPLTQEQLETVDTYAFYFQNELALTESFTMRLSGRYESLDFEVEDQFLSDGDQSGDIRFDKFTPMFGVVWTPFDGVNLYGNISTAFETPTLNQFENPFGAGFNPDLDAQTATNYEVGIKGAPTDRFRYEVAVFTIDIQDEIVPFEFMGDTFFRNAGESTRNGLEVATEIDVFDGLTATFSYTLNDFEYETFAVGTEVFDGNELPGIPKSQFYGELAYTHPTGFYAIFDMLHVGRMYADDANSAPGTVDPYQLATLRFGRNYTLGAVDVNPYFGINNLFGEADFANVRINQTFNRFYEPAPPRNVYGGLTVRYRFGS